MELAPMALLAGIVSISSPCCLPLLPGYLSFISGVSAGAGGNRWRLLGASLMFVLGFASVFTALGVSASAAGSLLMGNRPVILKVAGAFVILMGLAILGVLKVPILYRERRIEMSRMKCGPAGAFPLGMAFAFGWTPCIGPILAAVLGTAAVTATAARGAALLAIYSLGMGIPFLLIAFGYNRAGHTMEFLKRHTVKIEKLGGALLVLTGILLITGYWTRFFVPLIRFFSRSGWPPI